MWASIRSILLISAGDQLYFAAPPNWDGTMGFFDKSKENSAAVKQRNEEHKRKLADEQRAEAERQNQLALARKAAFDAASRTCPLRIQPERSPIAGGLELLNDEFVADVAKEWGFSTQKLTITTHRVVWSKGIVTTKDRKS